MAGQVRKRGERKWLVRVYLGRDPATGSRKWLSRTVYGTRREAEAVLHGLLRDRSLGQLTVPSEVRLSEFVGRWLEDARQRVRPRTLEWYEKTLRRWVLPGLGGLRLREITPLHVHRLYQGLQERGLGRSLPAVHACLRAVLRQAVKWSMLALDPTSRVRPPRPGRRPFRVLTPEEARRFLEAAREDSAWPLWWLLLETGMRPSEALALRWEDVDLERRVIRVRRSLVYVGGE
ncbi:MAG: site-specific integrase, partial [Armatimonadota bacterium]|nr:site-specific integrase [Armatimonadota bacterium]MDW8155929.1 site-specific integrase [Armatimonadota bacterium]